MTNEPETRPVTTFGRELRRGTLELLLLRLLLDGKKYGYRLATDLRLRSEGQLEVKEGTLYPVLYRLEDQGLIAPTWEQRERGVPRKYYELTGAGRRRLVELSDEWQRFSAMVADILHGGAKEDEDRVKTTEERES